jgi:hypothetical protein
MIKALVKRGPADRPGPDITNPLITSVQAAVARGRAEIDRNCSHRVLVSSTGPFTGWIKPGALVEVADSEQVAWRGMVRSTALTMAMEDGEYKVDINLTIEREDESD